MSDAGRTTWLPRDAAEHDRELIVILKEEFGADGPYTVAVLKDLAQQQRALGCVRTGFRSLRTKTGVIDADRQRVIVEFAADIGQLDDLEVDGDGRRFSCRVSGWAADQERGRASFRKAEQRANAGSSDETVTVGHGLSQNVPLTDQTRPEQETTTGEVQQVFDEWVTATERDPVRTKLTPERRRKIQQALKSHGLDDCLAAVRHIGACPEARDGYGRGTRYDDIQHALGNAERIERWRDFRPRLTAVPDPSPMDLGDRLIAGIVRGAG